MSCLALMLAVATTGQVRYWVDAELTGFGRDQVWAITAEAASQWMSAADVTIYPAASSAEANLHVRGIDSPWAGMTTVGGPNFFRRGGVARLGLNRNRAFSYKTLRAVATHEMGHALGLDHDEGVMAPTVGEHTRFSANNTASVASLWGPRRYAPPQAAPPTALIPVPIDDWPAAPPEDDWPAAPLVDDLPAAPLYSGI